MSCRIGDSIIICVEEPQQCDYCGKIAELRPYGKNNECICFKCGQKNEPITTQKMNEYLGF